jgi:hypothetical protein
MQAVAKPARRLPIQHVPAAEQVPQPAFTDKLVERREGSVRLLTLLAGGQLGVIALHSDPVLVMLAHDPAVSTVRQLPVSVKRISVEGQAIGGCHRRLPVIAIRKLAPASSAGAVIMTSWAAVATDSLGPDDT